MGGSMSKYADTTVTTLTFIVASSILVWCISRLFGSMTVPAANSFNSPSGSTLCRSMQGLS